MKFMGMILLFAAVAFSGCGEDSEPTRPNTFVPLTGLEADVDPASVPEGTFSRISAIGRFSGVFTRDLTGEAVWTSSNPSVARVGAEAGETGIVFAESPGTVTLTAETEDFSATTDLTVTDATIETLTISPPEATIAAGLTRSTFTAEGTFSDGTVLDLTPVVQWLSDDPSIATVEGGFENGGNIAALSSGSTTITAEFSGVSDTAGLTVTDAEIASLEISPLSPDLPEGFTLQFTATANFSDDTSEDVTGDVIWDSSDETVAVILNSAGEEGLAEGLSAGLTTISATFAGFEEETVLTVTDAVLEEIEFTPDVIDLTSDVIELNGAPITFTTTGLFSDATEFDLTEQVTFTSSDEEIALISNVPGRRGELTPLTSGNVRITAELDGLTIFRDITIR